MKSQLIATAIVCFVLSSHALAQGQELEKEVSKLADKLATLIKDQGKKKVAVLDFTDLQGAGSDLGKRLAEELTVDLVMIKRDFAVLDRANLRRVLAEHKLTATGLVDPENAKKLGMFTGVDALILGTIIPKGTNSIGVTVKIIATDTAEIVGATRAEFKSDDRLQKQLDPTTPNDPPSEKAQFAKSFGDLGVELHSLSIVNGRNYLLDIVLKNQNTKKSIWVALGLNDSFKSRAVLRSPENIEFESHVDLASGIASSILLGEGSFYTATEIKPGDSLSASIKFIAQPAATASAGRCTVQLQFLLGYSVNKLYGAKATPHNLTAKLEAK